MSLAELAVNPSKRFDWLRLFGPTFGLGTTFQLVPSQCRIKVCVATSSCFPGVEKPTAHASFGASASTAFNLLSPPATWGVATVVQLAPSQRFARILEVEIPWNPTAQASLVASADAPDRDSNELLATCTVVAVHAVPSQCSKRLKSRFVSFSTKSPTAQMSFAEVA